MHELLDPSQPLFWVLVAFLGFMGLLLYYGVPALVGKALDDRADGIRKELDDARKLREDAQALLADYQNKARQAENEARSIIEQAKREAEAMSAESKKSLAESLERRTKMAEEKITRAEAQAVSEVRASAVGSAMAAAEKILKARVPGATGDQLIGEAIQGLKGKLN
jgi:F-type H+-transporting ATPase subunit b